MASRHPQYDTPLVYERERPLLRGEGSSSRATSIGGDERRTRGSCRRRQRSPLSPCDEVLEVEHVTPMATNTSRDEGGSADGQGRQGEKNKHVPDGPAATPAATSRVESPLAARGAGSAHRTDLQQHLV